MNQSKSSNREMQNEDTVEEVKKRRRLSKKLGIELGSSTRQTSGRYSGDAIVFAYM